MAENDRVEHDEELYRNVRRNWKPPHYTCKDGRLTIEYHAFYDVGGIRPSVDRAKLLNFNPSCALLNDTNGIVSMKTGDVRRIGDINKVDDSVHHAVDVVSCPECDRPAHSLIIMKPEHFASGTKQRNAFRFLQKALARLATENGWTLPPPE
jgi:hypothetical protein